MGPQFGLFQEEIAFLCGHWELRQWPTSWASVDESALAFHGSAFDPRGEAIKPFILKRSGFPSVFSSLPQPSKNSHPLSIYFKPFHLAPLSLAPSFCKAKRTNRRSTILKLPSSTIFRLTLTTTSFSPRHLFSLFPTFPSSSYSHSHVPHMLPRRPLQSLSLQRNVFKTTSLQCFPPSSYEKALDVICWAWTEIQRLGMESKSSNHAPLVCSFSPSAICPTMRKHNRLNYNMGRAHPHVTDVRAKQDGNVVDMRPRPHSIPTPLKTIRTSPPNLSSCSVSDPSLLKAMTHLPCAVIVKTWQGPTTTRTTFRRTTNGVWTATERRQ